MRLLVLGHWSHTGFGTVTRSLAERFLAAGHDVRVVADNHRGEPVRGPLAGRVWPSMLTDLPNVPTNAITGALWPRLDPDDHWQPDRVLVIADMSGLFGMIGRVTENTVEHWTRVPVFHYCPIEGDNLPPSWAEVWKMVQPVAMSDYGQRVIGAHTGKSLPRIYHGVDTETFHPVSFAEPIRYKDRILTSREACKEAFGLAGQKVIFRADRNVIRKFYDRMIEAFVPIAAADPDVTLVLHCDPDDGQGFHLGNEIAYLPEDLHPRIRFTGMHDTWVGLDAAGLCALYNAADVYMSTTGGEGFGLTLAEALACETPVVCSDWAAEREVVGHGGIMVPPLHDSYGEPVRYHSGYGMDWAVPDPRGFTKPVLRLLAKSGERRAYGRAGRIHVKASFSWDTAAADFLTLLEEPDAVAA